MDVICSKENFFKNPQKLPLNELNFKYTTLIRTSKNEASLEEITGTPIKWQDRYQIKEEKKPALDKCWLSPEKRFVKFHPFYPQFSDKENEEFLRRNEEFLESIDFLTKCTYHQFWCYLMCEPRVSVIIKSFLENSISPSTATHLNEEFLLLYNKIYSTICYIYKRILHFNASPTEYMVENFVLPFLKRSKLLNIRSVFILCYIYNHSKPQFVKCVIDFYFSDKYKEMHMKELEELLIDILQEFEKLDKLTSVTNSRYTTLYKNGTSDPIWLEHTSSYILDQVASLQEFLSVYKPAFEIAFDLQLPQHIPHIYQKVYMQFYELLETKIEVGYDWSKCKTLIYQWLSAGRAEFVNLFRKFINYLYDKILDYKNVCAEQERYLEIFFELMSGAFDDELFIKDYNRIYPINAQFQLLMDNVNEYDKTQSDYLLEILENIVEEPTNQSYQQDNKLKLEIQKNDYDIYQNGESSKANTSTVIDGELYDSIYDTLSEYLHIQQSSSPNETKALPELVQTALNQYVQLMEKWENNMNLSDFDASSTLVGFESVNVNKPSKDEIDNRVKAVLEMLPDLEVDYIKRCLEIMNYRPEQVIARILDNDLPLDLRMSRLATSNMDKPGPSKAIEPKLIPVINKRYNNKDALHLLDDKTEKQEIKNLILKASYIYDLDDDYDDRNEIYNAYENSDESKIYRHLKQSDSPECNVVSDPSSSSEDEEVEESSIQNEKPRNAFCEDPAVVRARREAQRGRIFRSSRNTTNQSNTQKNEANVKQQRDKKNTHKSTRANHHRKGGAQWKRNRGMIPS